MPIYESKLPYEEMEKVIDKGCVCLECGAPLTIAWGGFYGHNEYMLRCGKEVKHEGIAKDASLSPYDIPGFNLFNLNKGRKKRMTEEHGEEKTHALAKYISTAAITKRVATEIVETLWGGAPLIEKTKCILLCQTYQLNPLMKHIYLVGYKHKVNGKVVVDGAGKPILDWSIQMGIGATRLLAQRKHHYKYLDYTPRKATDDEIRKILADTADPNCIYGFCWIRDTDNGAEATGLRGIETTASIKGTEKGNTHLNMACIRAERLALDRLYSGEMPVGVEVIDERFIEGDYKVVDEDEEAATVACQILKNGGEVKVGTYLGKVDGKPVYYGYDAAGKKIEGDREAAESPSDVRAREEQEKHWCEEHNCAFELKKGRYGPFYAHKKPEGGWCNEGKQKKKAAPAPIPAPIPAPVPAPVAETKVEEPNQPGPEPTPEPEQQQPKRDPETIKTITELYKACNEDFKLQPADVIRELGVTSQSDISDTPADCYRQIAKVRQ